MSLFEFGKIPPTNIKELSIYYIMQYTGKWYKWGGDDSSGFDCSGLAIEYLKCAGLVERKFDATAAMLKKLFIPVTSPYRGCLVFWKNSNDKIIHVEIMINETHSLGASGGGSKTLTIEDAIRDNAFVKIRPINTRQGIAGFVDPFLG